MTSSSTGATSYNNERHDCLLRFFYHLLLEFVTVVAEGIVLLKCFGSLSKDCGLGLGVAGVQDLLWFCWVGSRVGT